MNTALQHRNALRNILQDRGGLDLIASENRDLFNILSSANLSKLVSTPERSTSEP